MTRSVRVALSVLFAVLLPALALAGPPDPKELSRKLDELFRSKASKGRMTMTVVTPDFERTLGMNMVTRGMEDTLIRITSPRKEAGISTLKKGTEMWNYLPKVKKTVRVPPSMMMGAWMGSDFTNDDLVRASSWENDYDMAFVDGVGAGDEVCLRYTPKPSAAVTWDHIDTCFDGGTSLPHRQDFYDEKGRKARTLHFSEVKEMGGRTIPSVMTLEPLLKQGHRTVVRYEEIAFDVPISPNTFSMTALQSGG